MIARYDTPPLRTENDLRTNCWRPLEPNALVLVLDGVTDPHNLGACLRSAAAAKVTAVVVPKDRAVGITPTVRRASAGGADLVPVIAATNLARALRMLKDAGVWITGLAGDTEQSIYDDGPERPDRAGAGQRRRRHAPSDARDLRFRGAASRCPACMESLNVSVATGVVLFEALRQRGVKR